MRIEDLPYSPGPTWEEQVESSWVKFTEEARKAFSDNWWTARDAMEKIPKRDLPEPVQTGAASVGSLGRSLAYRRGTWIGPLLLEARGSGKTALQWRLRTLDETVG